MSAGGLYLDRRIALGRALPRRARVALMSALLAWNALVMAFLLAIRAYPVPAFLGLDLLGLWLAFHISDARARRGERVRVDAERVRVTREEGERATVVWSSPTAFTTVAVRRLRRGARVELRTSGRAVTVGAALGGAASAAFGRELEAAVRAARAERW